MDDITMLQFAACRDDISTIHDRCRSAALMHFVCAVMTFSDRLRYESRFTA